MAILRLLLGPSKRTASASNQDRRVESKCASLCVYGRIMEGQWNTRGHGPWAVRRQAVRQTSAFQTTMVTSTLRQSAVQRASASRRESQTKLSYVLDLRIQNTEQGGQGDFICKGEHQEGKSLSGAVEIYRAFWEDSADQSRAAVPKSWRSSKDQSGTQTELKTEKLSPARLDLRWNE